MASFRACVNKVMCKKSSKSGSGADEIYKPNWFAYNKMSFLRDKDRPRNTINTEVGVVLLLKHYNCLSSEGLPF